MSKTIVIFFWKIINMEYKSVLNTAGRTAHGFRPAAWCVGVERVAAQAAPEDVEESQGRAGLRPGPALGAPGTRLVAARPRVVGCSGQTQNPYPILFFFINFDFFAYLYGVPFIQHFSNNFYFVLYSLSILSIYLFFLGICNF